MLFNGGHNIPHPKDISIFQQNAYVIDSTTMGLLNISRLNPRNNISFNAQPDDYQTQINQIEISAIERQYSKWVCVFRNVKILTMICIVKKNPFQTGQWKFILFIALIRKWHMYQKN